MEGKIRLAVFGQKRLSREGGIEIVVKELCTRMAQNGCEVTCYNRAGHHVSGAEYDKTIEYDGIRQKVVPTIEKKGLAAVSSFFFAALCSACTALFSMKLINDTNWRFVSERDIISEDVYSLTRLFGNVSCVSVVPEAFYFYTQTLCQFVLC